MLTDWAKRIFRLFWFLPGFLLWAAYPPMGEKPDVLFALAPLVWLSRQGNPRESAKRWFQSGFLFWFATLSWMPAIVKNGGPWPLVALGWGALAAYCAAYFAAFGYLSAVYWRWVRGLTVPSLTDARSLSQAGSGGRRMPLVVEKALPFVGLLLVEPVLWCGLELVRSRFGGGFAWNQLGVVPINGGYGSPAAVGGVYLCSAVVLLINGTLAGIADRVIASAKRLRVSPLRTLETVLAFALIWAIYQMPVSHAHVNRQGVARDLKVAMVQRNFPCVFKASEENPYEVYAALIDNFAALKPDLLVLSESALCDIGPIGGPAAAGFADWVSTRVGASLLAGGSRSAGGKIYNSAAIYDKGTLQCYDKVHLVPFGEFIPGDKWFPALQKLAPVGSCTPGELKLLDFRGIKIGVAICFEDTDSAQVRRLAEMGADVLVFITNDSWFSQSNETVQHAWQSVARAIETGLPVIRVGNSGVTGTIAATGEVAWLQGADRRPMVDCRGTMLDRITVGGARSETVYTWLGDWPLGLAFALLLLTMVVVKYRHDYEKRRKLSL